MGRVCLEAAYVFLLPSSQFSGPSFLSCPLDALPWGAGPGVKGAPGVMEARGVPQGQRATHHLPFLTGGSWAWSQEEQI